MNCQCPLAPAAPSYYAAGIREVTRVAEILAVGEAMEPALALLLGGDVVAIPTETVYGLAGDATNGIGVARIFEAKGRPRFNPLIAHVADMAMAERIASFDPLSRKLALAFWPGPLTLVLPQRPGNGIHPLVTAGLDTIAVRMPRGFGGDLIARLGRPLAAPSANSSGKISATTAQAVAADLGGRIKLVVDGGATPVGLESTIVKAEGERLRLLRPGGIAADEIEAAIRMELLRGGIAGVEAPGMLASHYAPGAAVRLNAGTVGEGEALLAFGDQRAEGWRGATAFLNLSLSGDLREAASNLFAYMQDLDRSGARIIAVEPIPFDGLGEAINDRLSRAAAPRDNAQPTT
ncbi:threonylcarbamoyl-AMP synthase [Mesorhizobium sp. B2-5-9]|uniref:Threonylcarbamoyl-AMP synthase n=1 Tax=Mesorhizobium australicum (strain HAMBI 3006 / LMG 24608 / WSM2073) TaxID=754035 RepID=L0KTP8_MESAW|nr:Sua5/YciO/YrdC/YwlC family protein [Mesorhizobium australicum WSM2073]TPJ94746.1 threonylcarbamoyl-AMP synthase [Mesorhizobium sp. B2-5-9]TPL73392.1 threonylcarbamoyl-AMP synthase [Mesorhizobium sp. B2-3-15]